MKRCLALMTICFACFSAAACATHPKLTDPCDVLVPIDPAPATNSFLVVNDRATAIAIARHRGRFAEYKCRG